MIASAKHVEVIPAALDEIVAMREMYRREMNCQIVHDSWHGRGFTQSYLVRLHGEVVGYGAVGGAPGDPRDAVKEFFVLPAYRGDALGCVRALISASGARRIESQTNDRLLTLMLFDCATDIQSDTILFEDGGPTRLVPPHGGAFRPLHPADRSEVFGHRHEPVGEWGIEVDGTIVGTGGLLFHYNPPYGDIYMEVLESHRRRGVASYLVQELKRVCHEMGYVPAARCGVANTGSRRSLERAGMIPCARVLRGRLEP